MPSTPERPPQKSSQQPTLSVILDTNLYDPKDESALRKALLESPALQRRLLAGTILTEIAGISVKERKKPFNDAQLAEELRQLKSKRIELQQARLTTEANYRTANKYNASRYLRQLTSIKRDLQYNKQDITSTASSLCRRKRERASRSALLMKGTYDIIDSTLPRDLRSPDGQALLSQCLDKVTFTEIATVYQEIK